jgi:hypothetical protein
MSSNRPSGPTRGLLSGGCLALVAVLALSLAPAPLAAQSCILTRLDTPVLNAFDTEFNPAAEGQRWQATFGWRYGYSFRHFVGTEEQTERVEEHSNVVNNVNLADVSLSYNFSARNSISVGIPFLMATRSSGLRDENRVVVQRYTRSNNRGMGDITVVGHHLLWDPVTHRRSNISLGLGVKLPTGDNMQQQNTLSFDDNGEIVAETSTADNSVQPGDGGFGLVLEGSGYKVLNEAGSTALYGSMLYIVAPQATSGVVRPGARPGEEEYSISDQYVARTGLQFGPSSWKGWSAGLGARIEGIPVHDLVGSSDGRRRPGYILSAEPSVSWTHGAHAVTLAIPWAIERNRQRSVADIQNGGHGDAAFPDYIVLANYSLRF